MFKRVLKNEPHGMENEPSFITVVDKACDTCAYWDHMNPLKCEAFPDGIPLAILLGMDNHTRPWIEDGKEADKGLRYSPIDEDGF